ncbi:WGR domain-containing protein [Streptomyces sp. NPDC008343]|uniref:WGR domain-containing protein n=1 Tax=Streptomyces sp. NPDC008343 TaxID=3364828 RepID=UPI0036ED7E70
MQRWEYEGEGSRKFWEDAVDGSTVVLRFGRVGTHGQNRMMEFDTAEAASAQLADAVATRKRKGFHLVGEVAAVCGLRSAVCGLRSAVCGLRPAACAPAARADNSRLHRERGPRMCRRPRQPGGRSRGPPRR